MQIVIFGDVMLDRTHLCTTERQAPEAADIPIYAIQSSSVLLGGAANVARNLQGLNPAMKVELCTVLGKDSSATEMKALFDAAGLRYTALADPLRKTTVKTRLFAGGRLVSRADSETVAPISPEQEEALVQTLHHRSSPPDAILLIDYNKGVLTARLVRRVIAWANERGIPTFVDPKVNDHLKYRGCFCFKPNLREGQVLTGQSGILPILSALGESLTPCFTVLTCGEAGLYLDDRQNAGTPAHITHATGIPVVDVTGAGDVAMCVLVYVYLTRKDMLLAAQAANEICGRSIQCIGNYGLTEADLRPYAGAAGAEGAEGAERIVFTNGCFDLIHSAHIKLLNFAKKQGDRLIVGLNSDASVRRLKGPTRPINSAIERAELLRQLPMVDEVRIFEEDTPENLLARLKPDVLVKGGDYTVNRIVGREHAGEVVLFDYVQNTSSSITIEKIKALRS